MPRNIAKTPSPVVQPAPPEMSGAPFVAQSVLQRIDALVRGGRAGLTQIAKCLVPDFAPENVVGETVGVLGQAIGVDALDSLDDPGV